MLTAATLLSACSGDSTTAGSSLLDEDDAIVVCADTFNLQSGLVECANIITAPDSFLLGEIESPFGTLRADILTQLSCPVGYSYPANAEIDSIDLLFTYTTWTGDASTPLVVNVYEIDRKSIDYNPQEPYRSDVNIADYCSMTQTVTATPSVVVANGKTDSVYDSNTSSYVPMVRCRMSADFVARFAQMRSYTDQDAFNDFFKGLYITTSFGSATVLHVTDINLGVYYHFSYDKAGRDTTVQDVKGYYANSEVRQLNHLTYPDKEQLIERLNENDSLDFIIAPAGVYTRMTLPMASMYDTINANINLGKIQKRPYVNLAQLRVGVDNVYTGSSSSITSADWLQPADYMLLIKESSRERFFRDKELPSDTVAILSALTSGTDSDGNTIYYYSYDLSTLLTRQLQNQDSLPTLDMCLVPVSVAYASSSSSTVSSVRESQTISATIIHSAENVSNPLTLKVVYCGF